MNQDMSRQEFEQAAGRLVAWVADYLQNSQKYPVLHRTQPGAILEALGPDCPEEGTPMQRLLDEFEQTLVPGLTHWNHPRFFAYFSISASAPGVLADFLAAALNQQAMLWRTSPASTETEQATLNWLRQLMGLATEFEGVIYDTASVSTLHALACARDEKVPDFRFKGLHGPALTVYCSDQTHNSIDKAMIMLGLGLNQLVKIETDENFSMKSERLRQAIEEDIKAGKRPCAVVATIGTTSTTSVDPIAEIADICEEYDLWLHIDAAYGGALALLPEARHFFAGCERADSLVFNPHKWLFTPFDLSVLYCRGLHRLKRAFSLVAEYLETSDPDQVHNLMDTGIQLGRRFRSLKLWMIMRYFGAKKLAELVRGHLALAQTLAGWVDQDPNFERLAPVPMSVVCFRFRPRVLAPSDLDQVNLELVDLVNEQGVMFLSHTKLRGKVCLRWAVGHIRTTEEHLRQGWQSLHGCMTKVMAGKRVLPPGAPVYPG